MNRKTVKFIAIVIIVAMVITSFSFVMILPGLFGNNNDIAFGAETEVLNNTSVEELETQMDMLENYIKYLKEHFKDQVDFQIMIDGAFAGATDSLGDKYTEYYPTQKDSEEFIETVSGEYAGIGVVIEQSDYATRIVSTFMASPAEKAGIKAGDLLVKINDENVIDSNLEQVSSLLRGKVHTIVKVTVKRGIEEFEFNITRDIIKSSSVSKEIFQENIGYIKIASFDIDTGLEFETALEKLKTEGAEKIIIDLRDNGGGIIGSGLNVANLLIKNGVLVNFKNQNQISETSMAKGSADYNMETVVLINENSASTSEILAGALKENGVATLIGKTTYGKGIAQIISNVGNGNKAKISSYYFTTPKGNQIHGIGVSPDLIVDNFQQKGDSVINQYLQFAPMSEKTKPGLGDIGLNVFGTQQRLLLLGYKVKANGYMDKETYDAVKRFQAEYGLYSYGVIDYSTRDKIISATYNYVYGTGEGDKQLEAAIDYLKN